MSVQFVTASIEIMIEHDDSDYLTQQFSADSEPDHGDRIDDPTKPIILFPARKKTLEVWKRRIPLLAFLVFIIIYALTQIIALALHISSILNHSGMSSLAWILTTGSFLFVSLYSIMLPLSAIRARNALRHDTAPVLIISGDGIRIYLGPIIGTLNTIPWSHIGEVHAKRSFGEEYLGIYVKDLVRFGPTMRSKIYLLFQTLPSFFKTPPICIPEHFLHLDVADVAILINERRMSGHPEITENF